MTRYADLLCDWLVELGYTDCFFVAGGNIMHLLNAARTRFRCIPFVHEVAAGIAAEYFNEAQGTRRAFALVTAGPGLTNIVTAIAGAFLESRELLVIGGQVKSEDIADGGIRQRGIQEIDGVSIARPISVESVRLDERVSREHFAELVSHGTSRRPGPIFIEVCLDVQGAPADALTSGATAAPRSNTGKIDLVPARDDLSRIAELTRSASRPVLLIGGGVHRETTQRLMPKLRQLGIPLMTTWNGTDRVGAEEPLYFGRPNTWGQRYANVLIQQSDLIIALGTRLGMQQTGFNWREFGQLAKIVVVDIDRAELEKGHPRIDLPIHADANAVLDELCAQSYPPYAEWIAFCQYVRGRLPLVEPTNEVKPGYINPYEFFAALSRLTTSDDVVIPCSSGGAYSVAMQSFENKFGQIVITNKGLASMGYGLSGAIGASLAWPQKRTVLIEGDGGFIQNLQELATAAVNNLNLKIFIFSNEGYASIRTTQRTYFGGAYVGCDVKTGLGFPKWDKLFEAFDIPVMDLAEGSLTSEAFRSEFDRPGIGAFIVHIDPEQTYYPKISSRINAEGSMESNPLHLMTPELPEGIAADVFRYFSSTVAST